MTEDPASTVRQIIGDHFNIKEEAVRDEAHLHDDLGGDSLDDIEIAMKIEEAFSVDLSDDDVSCVRTVGDAIALARAKLGTMT